ncbi:peptidase inhibitor family I36 protein [Streptomyces sp. NPDC021098]|uniref:peptidase inhibitor family I36 protein n=1 Tax=unclassified Streptomyces TaxID=2593676 RepID=UPI0037B2EF34
MFARSMAVLAAAAGLATAAVVAAPAAQAAPSGCSSGALCAYLSESYTGGTPQRVWENNKDLTQYVYFYYMQGGSLYNNGTQCDVWVYTGKNYSGSHYELNRGTGWASIGSNLPHVSSNHWCQPA